MEPPLVASHLLQGLFHLVVNKGKKSLLNPFPSLQILFVIFKHIRELPHLFLSLYPLDFLSLPSLVSLCLSGSLCVLRCLPLSLCASVSVSWLGNTEKVNHDSKGEA